MQELKLLDVKVEKISFKNDIYIPNVTASVDIRIGTKISSTVSYDSENTKCKCATTVELYPENIQVDFSVMLCVTGVFDCGQIEDRKKVHVEAYKKLFPHVQSRVTSFMTIVGFPNFLIDEPQIDVNDVLLNT